MSTLLGIFAHPDDESVAAGGTLAKYAKAGWNVELVCATRGDAGNWGGVEPTAAATLSQIRTKELGYASVQLGVRSVTFLDYKDGTLKDTHPGGIENDLIRIMEETKPDVVITHEPAGITNHPDHIKMSYAATFAFQVYAGTRADENPSDPNPPKLYYACFPESVISYVVNHKYFPGELFDKPVRGVEDKRVTTVINIKRFAPAKHKAMLSHATQQPILAKYQDIPNNPFFAQEYFVLRYVGLLEAFMGKNDRVSDRL